MKGSDKEPRFLLDEDSICYGCPEYKRIEECSEDPWDHWGEADENGGVCDAKEPCLGGSRNAYRHERAMPMEAEIKIKGLEELKDTVEEINETATDLMEKMERLKSAAIQVEVGPIKNWA